MDADQDGARAARTRSPRAADNRPLRERRILIVDDDLAILEALEVLLGAHYEVLTATDGEKALRLIHDGSIDLVVSDVLMPLLAGEELVLAARASGARIPVILISGHAERLERAKTVGADAYLYKPFPLRVLEERIERLLADH
ncbi:MAG TPA: response regulator [Thermoanaerobaculia bacterium]|nr:response regulator [Thermoanaerobaculia bacterium]